MPVKFLQVPGSSPVTFSDLPTSFPVTLLPDVVSVTDDLIGLSGFYPKFVKKYLDLQKHLSRDINNFTKDVKSNTFPTKSNTY